MKPHKHCEVIKAWADGAEIEYRRSSSHEWETTSDPMWAPSWDYRVKPQTIKYRVALFGAGNEKWAYICNTTRNERADEDPSFVRWLTDWIEVEV